MIAVRKGMYFGAALAFAGSLFAADPFVGRWRLDLAKTTTTPQNPSAPRPKEVTLVAKDQGEYREITVHGLNADGSPIKADSQYRETEVPGKGRTNGSRMVGPPWTLLVRPFMNVISI